MKPRCSINGCRTVAWVRFKLMVELDDLSKDPGEAKDVAGDHPEIVARMTTILKSAREPTETFPFRTLD